MNKKKSFIKNSIFVIGAMHVANKIIDSASIVNNTTRSNGKYYHWKHGDIFYRTFGDESLPPFLMLHDLTAGSSSHEWLKLAKALSDTYHVYCVDLIGCGKSDKLSITYTNYFYVQMITDFVNEVIGKKTKVAVTGLSGSFVLMANHMNKDLFEDIMLVNPSRISALKQIPDDRSKLLMKLFELPVIGKTAYYFMTSKSNMDYYLTETCFFNSFHMEPSIVKSYYDAAHTGNGNGKYLLASIMGNFIYSDITRALKNADNPIYLVCGQHNPDRDNLIQTYGKINENLIYETISGSKMLPQFENEEEMLELLYRI